MRFILAALCALLLVPVAQGAKPARATKAPQVTLTLTLPGSYHVERPTGPLNSLYVLTHRCWTDGSVVENDYTALPWYTSADVSADLGPYPVVGEYCEAFVWAFPDSVTPVSNTVTYASPGPVPSGFFWS